jgi:signal transduction histidine kinase
LDKYIELNIYSPANGQFALLGQDITFRKKAEEDIKIKNIELAELNASKDKFFSIIAHDLRSPFNGFLGLTKLMAEETKDFTLRELQDLSQKMQNSANNLYKLLENLLEWSRIQRGHTEFKPVKTKLGNIIRQCIEIESEYAKNKNIELIYNNSKSFEANIDIPMMETVLRNLVSNSIKFTERGGKVEIGMYMMPEGVEPSAICIYVKDNGIGMEKNRLEKLFKLDQNVTRPGTEKEHSTGLGLLLCKEFITKHGGKIWAESEENKGSTFYFTLPAE